MSSNICSHVKYVFSEYVHIKKKYSIKNCIACSKKKQINKKIKKGKLVCKICDLNNFHYHCKSPACSNFHTNKKNMLSNI